MSGLTQEKRAELAIRLCETLLSELESATGGYELHAELVCKYLRSAGKEPPNYEPVLLNSLTVRNQARVVLNDLKNEGVWDG